ncbi:hypothetical protein [Streptosporangium sp. NPDC051022]|uniref:hypothetical protein n=1 Tax=Streptosporangium sp. NPDC051022 TaxID=3155752 RepID=UPI00341414B3
MRQRHVVRDRLAATGCTAANRYLEWGRDQLKPMRELEDASTAVARAKGQHEQRSDEWTAEQLERTQLRWRAARAANRAQNIAVMQAQTAAQAKDARAAEIVTRELMAMWADYDARWDAEAESSSPA